MRLLHRKAGGAMDGALHLIMMMRMEYKSTPIKIKTWASRTVSGCLDTRVGGKKVHLVTYTPIRDIVCWQWKAYEVPQKTS